MITAIEKSAANLPARRTALTNLCIDILDDAYSFCGYWASTKGYRKADLSAEWKPHNGEGPAFIDGDVRNNWKRIRPTDAEAAMRLICSLEGADLCSDAHAAYIAVALRDPDAYQGDAETADVIVQIALFGEIVFG